MSKRTVTSPYVVEYRADDDRWCVHSYENSLKMARRTVRNFAAYHKEEVRMRDNPNRVMAKIIVFPIEKAPL